MKTKIKKIIWMLTALTLIFIFVFGIIYLLTSFIMCDFSFYEWGKSVRFIYTFISFMFYLLFCAIINEITAFFD